MQSCFSIFVVIGEQLELRVQHGEFAGIVIELDFSEEREAFAGLEGFRQILTVKPLSVQDGARGVCERCLEEPEVTPPEARQPGAADLCHYCRHLSGSQLRDGLGVTSIFVAKRNAPQQVLYREQRFGLEHGGARGAHAFDVGEGS